MIRWYSLKSIMQIYIMQNIYLFTIYKYIQSWISHHVRFHTYTGPFILKFSLYYIHTQPKFKIIYYNKLYI